MNYKVLDFKLLLNTTAFLICFLLKQYSPEISGLWTLVHFSHKHCTNEAPCASRAERRFPELQIRNHAPLPSLRNGLALHRAPINTNSRGQACTQLHLRAVRLSLGARTVYLIHAVGTDSCGIKEQGFSPDDLSSMKTSVPRTHPSLIV